MNLNTIKELLKNAKLEMAEDMNGNKVVDIEIEDNTTGLYAQCMGKDGIISFYTEPVYQCPVWYTIDLKDIGDEKELQYLYEMLKKC